MAVYFMKPSEIIHRLRSTISLVEANLDLPVGFVSYGQNVAGSEMLGDITEENIHKLPSPCILVSLIDGSSETSNYINVDQNIFHGFNIHLILDTEDRRKQSSQEKAVIFKSMLIYALNGWKPVDSDKSASPLRFISDAILFSDRSKYVHVFTFEQDYRFIASQDGLGQLPEEFDLADFETFIGDLVINGNTTGVRLADLYEGN